MARIKHEMHESNVLSFKHFILQVRYGRINQKVKRRIVYEPIIEYLWSKSDRPLVTVVYEISRLATLASKFNRLWLLVIYPIRN